MCCNLQVQRFYQQMGGVMAARCNELGAVQSRQGKTATKAQQKSTQSMQMLSKPQQKRSAAQCKIEEL